MKNSLRKVLKGMGFEFCYKCNKRIPIEPIWYYDKAHKYRLCHKCWLKLHPEWFKDFSSKLAASIISEEHILEARNKLEGRLTKSNKHYG